METHFSKSDFKNMDICLKRLKQELVRMSFQHLSKMNVKLLFPYALPLVKLLN